MFKVPEKFRLKKGIMGSTPKEGNNGAFSIKTIKFHNIIMHCIASDGAQWEHVSVSIHDRTPTWEEMSYIKNLFWDETDLVIQLHPPQKEYVNCHPYCLHLWRKCNTNDYCETPPSFFVGPLKGNK